MRLNEQGLKERAVWEEKGYALPAFDREAMAEETAEHPVWVHFGAGNIFRAFHAALAQKMLEKGSMKAGIVVAEGFDYEIITRSYAPHDNYSVLVTLKADGSIEKTVIGSIARSAQLDSSNPEEYEYLKQVFAADSLQMATFTITEKGYSLVRGDGSLLPDVAADFQAGPEKPASYMGKVASLLHARFLAGAKPVAMVSTDNCSHNGDKLYAAIHRFAKEWTDAGKAAPGFLAYVEDPARVSFPWSMIDKITPRPDASVEKVLREDGLEELDPVVTSRNTYIAPFVNAEESEYLVIEDAFPNGRPALEEAGVIFTGRETVDKVERMKVCTCLNPLHTALAVFGCLLGYTRISDEMKDEDLVRLVRRAGYVEGLPVVTDPGVINPKDFIDTVVNVRVPNPFMPDTPQRIATDTSQKLAIRFGETVKAYVASDALDVADLKAIPLVFAGWLRYLMGIDDEGKAFERSSDPLLEEAGAAVAGFALGAENDLSQTDALLKRADIFGVDLFEAGLADEVKANLKKMLAGPGAVRNTLHGADF